MKARSTLTALVLLLVILAGCTNGLPGEIGPPGTKLPDDEGGGLVGLVERRINSGVDDGWRDGSVKPAAIVLGGDKIWFGGAPGSYEADAIFRWTSVHIPKEATILEAYVEVKHIPTSQPGLNKWNTRVDIRGFAYDNLSPFRISQDTDTLHRTNSTVPWDILEPWSSTEAMWHRTPDLKEIIQEIVDRPGWRAGNALGIAFDSRPGNRPTEYNRSIYTFDSDKENAPRLVVRFTR